MPVHAAAIEAEAPACRWVRSSAEAVAGLAERKAVFGLFRGEFSLLDLIVAVLGVTGPADLTVATWTAATREIDSAAKLLQDGNVRGIRWLVDMSFPRRQPVYCRQLLARFGAGAIRCTKSHAKFTLIRNENWNVALRTSANLNRNPRFEFFELSDAPAICEFLAGLVDRIWAEEYKDPLTTRPKEFHDAFEELGRETQTLEPIESSYGVDLTDPDAPAFEVLGRAAKPKRRAS